MYVHVCVCVCVGVRVCVRVPVRMVGARSVHSAKDTYCRCSWRPCGGAGGLKIDRGGPPGGPIPGGPLEIDFWQPVKFDRGGPPGGPPNIHGGPPRLTNSRFGAGGTPPADPPLQIGSRAVLDRQQSCFLKRYQNATRLVPNQKQC